MRAVVIDTETTGLEEPELIQVAYIDVFEPMQRSYQGFRPSKPIEYGALATHHILPSDLDPCEASSAFRLPSDVEYLIGFNVDFDWAVIGKPATKNIDLCAICRILYEECDSHKQAALAYFLFGVNEETRDMLRGAHDAYDDCLIALKILRRIQEDSGHTDIAALFAYSEDCRVPRKMPFGKFQGQPIAEVDAGYRRWYSNVPDADPWILKAFERFPFR